MCKTENKTEHNIENKKVCLGCDEERTPFGRNVDYEFRKNQDICIWCEEDPDLDYDKKCNRCEEVKPNSDFRKNRNYCLPCERNEGRNYRKTTTKAKEWADANPEKLKQLQRNNYEINKKEIRAKEKKRKLEDPNFKQIKDYRTTINRFITGNTKSNALLNINRDFYLSWISFCFDETMTFKNRKGYWQIDHVLPLNLLYGKNDLLTPYINILTKECGEICIFEWYNTTPILKENNRTKSNKISIEHIVLHLKNIHLFLKNKEKKELSHQNPNFSKYIKLTQQFIDMR